VNDKYDMLNELQIKNTISAYTNQPDDGSNLKLHFNQMRGEGAYLLSHLAFQPDECNFWVLFI
jgi:hypothetical protein